MATDTSELLYEVKDRIATITLNRPDKMNAFTGPMIERWAASLQEAQRDPHVNVVVVTGAGKAFCSGGDVGRMAGSFPLRAFVTTTGSLARGGLAICARIDKARAADWRSVSGDHRAEGKRGGRF